MFNRDDFRSGKMIPFNGGSTYKQRVCKVVSMDFLTVEELKLKKGEPNDLYLVFMVEVEGVDELQRLIQKVKIGENGELNNPMLPSNTNKEGRFFPASLAYDIWAAIRTYLTEMGDAATLEVLKAENGLTLDRYKGQTFRMSVMEVKGKEGRPNWYKFQTSYQKEQDRRYKEGKVNGEKVMEEVFADEDSAKNADLDDMPF